VKNHGPRDFGYFLSLVLGITIQEKDGGPVGLHPNIHYIREKDKKSGKLNGKLKIQVSTRRYEWPPCVNKKGSRPRFADRASYKVVWGKKSKKKESGARGESTVTASWFLKRVKTAGMITTVSAKAKGREREKKRGEIQLNINCSEGSRRKGKGNREK